MSRPLPDRRRQAALSIRCLKDVIFVHVDAIPQLAGHRHVLLIQRFAVIGVFADDVFVAAAKPNFQKPVGVGQCCGRRQYLRCLPTVSVRPAESRGPRPLRRPGYHGRRTDVAAYPGGWFEVTAERALFVGKKPGRAFVAARSGIGIGCGTDRWLLRIFEPAAARQR